VVAVQDVEVARGCAVCYERPPKRPASDSTQARARRRGRNQMHLWIFLQRRSTPFALSRYGFAKDVGSCTRHGRCGA